MLPSVDFEAVRKELAEKGAGTTDEDVILTAYIPRYLLIIARSNMTILM